VTLCSGATRAAQRTPNCHASDLLLLSQGEKDVQKPKEDRSGVSTVLKARNVAINWDGSKATLADISKDFDSASHLPMQAVSRPTRYAFTRAPRTFLGPVHAAPRTASCGHAPQAILSLLA